MSQAMMNEIEELRGRVYALEQELAQIRPAITVLTPEMLEQMRELFHGEPAKKKRG